MTQSDRHLPPRRTRRTTAILLAGTICLASIGCTTVPAEPNGTATRTAPASVAPRAITSFRPKGTAPTIIGKSAIVIDARSGRILHTKAADTQRAIASTQKLLTALVVIDRGGLNDRVTVAKSDTWVEPSKLYIQAGQSYRKNDLLAALLVRSGNDVARCLARTHSGGQEAFAAAMNAKARALGMRHSNFKNPHGLTVAGQYSTARDLGILGLAAYHNRTIRSYTAIKKLPFRYSDGRQVTFTNTNKVLHRSPYCTGLKTGYTSASGRCLVCSGKNGGREVVVVVIGSNSSNIWNDSQKLLHWGLGVGS
jgi:D-alanyl-D-alanine carboxypeptidase (penicillin-binding protein 5/6)